MIILARSDRPGARSFRPELDRGALAGLTRRLAAWAGEKIGRRSRTTADGQPAFGRDLLLSTLTRHRASRTAASSLLPYWAYRRTASAELPADEPAPVPTAIDLPRGEVVRFPEPRRELAGRYFTIAAWGEHDRGGRFPTAAEPRLLAARLRPTIRPSRQP